jgi:hypothetical protein
MKSCSRCSRGFFPAPGNSTLCGSCKAGRREELRLRRGVTRTFGERRCDRCWREFVAVAENQRYCSARCKSLARRRDDAKYARPEHRGARRVWAGVVAGGSVRCARGAACRRREFVDGQLVGGFIDPGEHSSQSGSSASGSCHGCGSKVMPHGQTSSRTGRVTGRGVSGSLTMTSKANSFSFGDPDPGMQSTVGAGFGLANDTNESIGGGPLASVGGGVEGSASSDW